MFVPTSFPCTAWLVADCELREVTLDGRHSRHVGWLTVPKKKSIYAGDLHATPGGAIAVELEKIATERTRLQKLLANCAERETAVLALRAKEA